MLFPTITFAIFFMLVWLVNWLLLARLGRWKVFMLAASYFFYAAWDWRFVMLLVASTAANQAFAVHLSWATDPRGRRRILTMAVASNLLLLGWFKYYGFFVSSLMNLGNSVGVRLSLPLLHITLPVGISFLTFQALGYVIDVYRRDAEPAQPMDFAVFMAFFPRLVAGPIMRAREFMPQIAKRPDPRKVDASRAFVLIFRGLFKKVVISGFLAQAIVDPVFATPDQHSALEALVGIYGYAAQIYADFSGYTDMAIGLALLLGFELPDNFNAPYAARSVRDFWRRWHMTLSRWLRDYLYVPLGGSRGSEAHTYFALMATMLLGGLWHGAGWTFVAWGGMHGLALALERFWETRKAARAEALGLVTAAALGLAGAAAPEVGAPEVAAPAAPGRRQRRPPGTLRRLFFWALTFHWVCFAWVFFRADSFDGARAVLGRLGAHWGPSPSVTLSVVAAIAVVVLPQALPKLTLENVEAAFSRLRPAWQGLAMAAALVVIDAMKPEGIAPFIYYKF